NRTYVSRALNDTGKTFIQIINDYRIREAITMMSDFDANIPLKQICGDVGFSSISTFYSTFQNVTGMTPARYRAQLKEMKK
ncbi:MAG: helix-turn-helix domain-containing protein, partial [Duncaniella sp.]|nr:helix-turn-helix domain-containing protein [Duncaniella sp.]